jgi:hypothetical protein
VEAAFEYTAAQTRDIGRTDGVRGERPSARFQRSGLSLGGFRLMAKRDPRLAHQAAALAALFLALALAFVWIFR